VGALARYVAGAALARTADAGAVVGLVLLAAAGPAGSGAAGLLAASITAPHLAGPVVARRLDRSRDIRKLLALACLIYAVALAAGSASVGRTPLAVSLALLLPAGLCGPVLTGGLSSHLPAVVRGDEVVRRRAQGWDAVTYGVAGSLGPSVVALVAATTSALPALLLLSTAAVAAGVLVLSLPTPHPGTAPAPGEAVRLRDALRLVAAPGLRRAAGTSTVASLVAGAGTVFAVGLAVGLGRPPAGGALLAALFGLGNLAGSFLVTAVPLRGDPDRSVLRLSAVVALTFAACGLAPSYPLAVAAFVAGGIVNGPFFAATLAARTEYAPAGGRAQVFVTMAAAKVAASAAGAAIAGAVGLARAREGLVGGGLLVLAVTAALAVDRKAHPPQPAAVDIVTTQP
jgi:MFS family permease